MQMTKIAPKEQESVLSSFWMMLGECETRADNDDDRVLKHQVAQWYQQWNRITGDTKEPRWVERDKRAAAKLG
jgi:hypothetical protein